LRTKQGVNLLVHAGSEFGPDAVDFYGGTKKGWSFYLVDYEYAGDDWDLSQKEVEEAQLIRNTVVSTITLG